MTDAEADAQYIRFEATFDDARSFIERRLAREGVHASDIPFQAAAIAAVNAIREIGRVQFQAGVEAIAFNADNDADYFSRRELLRTANMKTSQIEQIITNIMYDIRRMEKPEVAA
ncbi:hypothetical protein LJR098_001087 [Rhizobium sp. LjRoot98]|uniref:hypothetical protein n=1 Tax=Rhizobium sp. LjRoot98 TaxID=3342345 RepID=UPI003ECF9DF9